MPKAKGKKVHEDVDDMDVDVDVEEDEEVNSKSKGKGKGNKKEAPPAKGKDKKVQEDSDEEKPKKGGKQQKKAASDDEEEERPQKGKGKKGNKKQESDEESEEPQQKAKSGKKEEKGKKGSKKVDSDEEDTAPKSNKKGGKKEEEEPTQKKGGKQKKGKKDESEDEEEAPQSTKGKKGNKKQESDEEEEPAPKKGGKQSGKKGNKKAESDDEEVQSKGKQSGKKGKSEEPDEETKKGGKQKKKGNKKDESEDEEEPAPKAKQTKKGKKVESEDEEEEEPIKKSGKQAKKGNKKAESEEEEEPVKKGGKQAKKGGKKEESEEEEEPVKKGGKQAKKGSKKEESEEEEEPVKKGGKQAKKGNKKEESDEEPKQKTKQTKKGKKAESEEEEEESEEEVVTKKGGKSQPEPKGKQQAKKGGKKAESEDEEEEEEEESEEEVVAKKGGKSQPAAKKAPAKEKKEEEPEEKVSAAGMVSKKNKKNKKKGGKKADSDSEPEVKGGFAGLDVEDDEEEASKPKGKKKGNNKPAAKGGFSGLEVEDEEEEETKSKGKKKGGNNKPASSGFAGLDVEGDEEEAEEEKEKGKKKGGNNKQASSGFAGLEVEGEEEKVVKGMEDLSIKEKKAPRVKKGADDTRSKKQIRMEKKNAAKSSDVQDTPEVKEKTAEELEEEAAERYNRAQEMKGREPPSFVHLRNSEEVRSKLGNDIKVENYTLQVPGRTLLTEASFTLAYGHRYGFVGRNGLGKSSLLQKIADRDGIQIANHLRVLYVEQEVPGDDTLPIDYVLKADVEREWLLQEEKILVALEAQDADWMDNPDEKRCYGLKEIYERLRDIESEKAVSRASAILVGLGFDAEEIKVKTSREFSGGWRMRISLARALFCRPEVLLLDEPTNHLDLHACFWLERYLSKWKSTLLVVSHEATFLNEIVNHIIEIRNKKLITYKGDYWSYQKTREVNEKTKEKLKDKTDKEKARLKNVIQRTAGKAGASGKDKILAKIEDVVIERDDPSLKVSFPEPDTLPPPIYQFQDVSFGYDASKPPLFKNLEFGIDMDSRIALVGLNGVGKSTLMKLMAGELKETSGYISRNRKARIARFSQHSLEQLDQDKTPAQYLDSKFNIGSEHTLRQHLGRFGITGNLALNKIDTLSGGQKSRVVLAELAWAHPHILFLDEPSNHLDLDAIEALAQGLNAFTGGVVLISHNQRLISLVCSEIWVVTKAGTVDRFNGEFDDYKEDILAHMDFAGIDDEEEVDEAQEREREKEKRKAKKAEKEEKEDLRPKKGKKNKNK